MFDFTYPQKLDHEARGWPGWRPGMPIGVRPADLPGEIVPLVVRGAAFPGGIRAELHDLVVLLVDESLDRGMIPRLDDPGCWGGAFRPTKRADGTFTNTPSAHSAYTAVDINAPHNVFGATTHQIPERMAALWREYGWRWLGPPIKDWMHFDFAGTVDDARDMLRKALRELRGDDMTEEQLEKLRASYGFTRGIRLYAEAVKAGAEDPTYSGDDEDVREGFRFARQAFNRPQPAPLD
jgi:hypothetical protein